MGILNNIFSKIFPSAQAAVGHAKDAVKEQVDKITDTVKDKTSDNTSSNNTNNSNPDQKQQNTSDNKAPISEVDVMIVPLPHYLVLWILPNTNFLINVKIHQLVVWLYYNVILIKHRGHTCLKLNTFIKVLNNFTPPNHLISIIHHNITNFS